jgi:23S rRNA pseudouridine2605 synthase
MELLPEEWRGRLFPVGRLDKDTTGLLLLTDDGDLAHRCLHPSHHVAKTYRARVDHSLDNEALRQLREGVALDEGLTAPAEVRTRGRGSHGAEVEITIREGRNRQVRRMLQAVGHPVGELRRMGFGPLLLGELPEGKWRPLTATELRALQFACGLSGEAAGD